MITPIYTPPLLIKPEIDLSFLAMPCHPAPSLYLVAAGALKKKLFYQIGLLTSE
jgi:hypothetical protein